MGLSPRVLVVGMLLLGASAPVLAKPAGTAKDGGPLAQAKAHFLKGREAYEAGDYIAAIREFQAAQALSPSPLLDYNIGLAQEQFGDRKQAVAHYRAYLEAKPDATNRPDVEQRIAALDPAPPPTVDPVPEPPPVRRPDQPQRPRPEIQCPAGQTVTEDTADHCCWGGQVWSKRRAACAGIPQCPAGLQVSGETCIKAVAPLPPLDMDPWAITPTPRAGPPPPTYAPRPVGAPGTVQVTFTPKRREFIYVITAGKQSCATPCSLFLKPGSAKIGITGAGEFSARFTVPTTATVVEVQHRRIGSLVAGSILVFFGTVAAISGTVLVAPGPSKSCSDPPDCSTEVNNPNFAYGVVAFLASAVLLPIGIPTMSKMDANEISLHSGTTARAPDPGPGNVRLIGAGLGAWQGGAGASLRFAF
ncbi:MAG: tetratricopeptide repeat protein [Myxococcales bacterium]|nr:tetratricopeptide repeat protein [Myxococcales bacterium]